MLSLIPAELHDYSLSDIGRSLMAAGKSLDAAARIPLPGLGDGIPIRSARTAVIIALKALPLPAGARIGVPLYCCPVVFKAIKAARCTPCFIDADPATLCLSVDDLRVKRAGLDAMIAVHMFGNACDMPTVLRLMEGKPVIEDCAQSIGTMLEGRACGSFGDIAIFSFRSGKYLSVGEGGALFAQNALLRGRLGDLTAALPSHSLADEIKHIIRTYIRSKLRSRPLWGLVGSRIWDIYNRRTDFADKSPIMTGKMFSSDYSLVIGRIHGLGQMISAQRAHADYFARNLGVPTEMLHPEGPGTFLNRYMFPITLMSEHQRDLMAIHLRRDGMDTAKPYQEVIRGAARYYGYLGDCPVTESISDRVIRLPFYNELNEADQMRVVAALNEFVCA